MLMKDASARKALLEALADVLDINRAVGERGKLIEQVRKSVDDADFPGAVLPVVQPRQLIFYAVAETGPEWRELAPLLMASVGVTTTDFTGRMGTYHPDDPVEQRLREYPFFAVARFTARSDPKREELALHALARLSRLVTSGAQLPRTLPKSTAQVLHDFAMALSVRDREAAEQAIQFLQANMRIDALNHHFLQVQFDATFQEWERLRTRPFFGELCLTRRPPSVTSAMVEALYWTTIQRAELEDRPQAAIEAFRQHVRQQCGTLFAICPPAPRAAVGKAFLLAALTSVPPNETIIDHLKQAAEHWLPEEAHFFYRLLEVAPQDAQSPVPARQTPPQPDYQAQLDAALDDTIPPTIDRARAVLLAAAGQQTLDASRSALAYVGRLEHGDLDALLSAPFIRTLWEEMTRYAGQGRVPSDWREWLEMLPHMTYAQAAAWAEAAVEERPIGRQLERPEDVKALVSVLSNTPTGTEDQLYNALPYLVKWVSADDHWPNPAYLALYREIFDLLLLSDNHAESAYKAVSALLHGMLAAGLSIGDYEHVLGDLGGMLSRMSGARDIDWLVDLAELTISYACPAPSARVAFWHQIIVLLNQYEPRVTQVQRIVLADLASILGIADTLAALPTRREAPSAPAVHTLGHYVIGIYTLTEGIGERVARVLAAEYPGVEVKVNHDAVNTTQLKDLAKRADLLVVCWLSAKHAATNALNQERPNRLPTIYATGTGSSSILRQVRQHLEALQAA